MARGRKPRLDPPIKRKWSCRKSLDEKITEHLPKDILTGRPLHGAYSTFLEGLVKEYFDKLEKANDRRSET